MRIPRLNSLVEVEFLDHIRVSGHVRENALSCTVWGRLIKKTKDTIVVRSWDGKDEDNNEDSVLLRKTLVRVTRLVKEKP